jgi:hypothetical protein
MTHQEFIRSLGRHFVNLCWIDETPNTIYGAANNGHGKPFTTSAFIISVLGNWFLVTAGHILADIKRAREAGQRLTNFMLDDTWGPTSKFPSMHFEFDDVPWKCHIDQKEQGLDYGVMQLVGNIRDRLEANGVEAVTECYWKEVPEDFEQYFLLGTPDKLQKVDATGGLHVRRTLIRFDVERLIDPPEIPSTTFPRIYYKIPAKLSEHETGELLTDIDGMSGCPLYGVKTDNEGKHRIYVVGIQSGWRADLRIAFASPLKVLGENLEILVNRSLSAVGD